MIKRVALPFAAVLAVLGLFYLGLGSDPGRIPSPLVEKPAPPFELQSLTDPNETVTEQDFIGEVALVNVFASWCGTCRQEKSNLLDLARHGVTIYGLNYRDDRQAALAYLESGGNPYARIAYDPEGDAGIDWGVYGTPETYLLDAEGRIRHKHVGPMDAQMIREELLPMIEHLKAKES